MHLFDGKFMRTIITYKKLKSIWVYYGRSVIHVPDITILIEIVIARNNEILFLLFI